MSSLAEVDLKQNLRMRRFFMAVATYAACGVFVLASAWLGYVPSWLPEWWIIGFGLVSVVFFLIFRSGWNLRLRDPSLTEAQLFVSMFAVMVLVYYADEARGTFLMLFPVPLLFGVLRLRLYQMVRVGMVGMVGYACVIALLVRNHPHRVLLAVEVLNLLALSGVMGFVCLMGGYISKVRAELSRSLAIIRDIAHHDPLTGVFNRRHLMETLSHQVVRCERQLCRGFALCLIDVDHFKRINDTWGHPVGDEVLSAVAKRIGDSIREVDYIARYGGEEFVVLLEGGGSEPAVAVCERIRADVARMVLPELGKLPLRVSIGVADYVAGNSAATMLERADRALYVAKGAGRNCVHIAPLGAVATTTVVGHRL